MHPRIDLLKASPEAIKPMYAIEAYLKNCGLDPEKYQGFAFGMGLDRLTMLKYGIPDLRAFFSGDLKWLSHYGFSMLDVPTLGGGLSS